MALIEITTKSTFIFNIKYYKQTVTPWEDQYQQCFLISIYQNLKKTPFYHQGNQNYINVLLTTSLQDKTNAPD